jgi:hypothetical protein
MNKYRIFSNTQHAAPSGSSVSRALHHPVCMLNHAAFIPRSCMRHTCTSSTQNRAARLLCLACAMPACNSFVAHHHVCHAGLTARLTDLALGSPPLRSSCLGRKTCPCLLILRLHKATKACNQFLSPTPPTPCINRSDMDP